MFGKQSKGARLNDLEEDVDDLWHEVFCDQNAMSVKKRLHRLEEFKGAVKKDLDRQEENIDIRANKFKEIDNTTSHLYDLYERLGEKVKYIESKRLEDKAAIQIILIALLKHLGLRLNENDELEVVKTKTIKKNAKPLSTPIKNNKRKTK